MVLSASISTTIQAAIGGNERAITAVGISLLAGAVPLVVLVLWMAFIVRCAWFLRRLRGWRERPAVSRVPEGFLRSQPALRAVAIGLAHPGLLLAGGLGSALLVMLLALGSGEFTLTLD